MSARRGASLAVAAGAAVVGSYLGVRSGVLARCDRRVAAALTSRRPRRVDPAVARLTDLGSSFAVAGAATALAALGRRQAGRRVAVAGTAAWALSQAVKPALRRPRPYELGQADRLVSVPAGSSWPSGHAAVAAATASALADPDRPVLTTGLALGAVGVAASRVAVGVHHPSDTVAGLALGVLAEVVSRPLAGRPPAAGS